MTKTDEPAITVNGDCITSYGRPYNQYISLSGGNGNPAIKVTGNLEIRQALNSDTAEVLLLSGGGEESPAIMVDGSINIYVEVHVRTIWRSRGAFFGDDIFGKQSTKYKVARFG